MCNHGLLMNVGVNIPWSNEELLALLRIGSNLENSGSGCWFPVDFTWEHVSRKLGELGFKRSPAKCKEKFEEESRYLSNISCSDNYRLFGELEHLYHSDPQHHNDHTEQHHQDPCPSFLPHHHHHHRDQNDDHGDDNDLENQEHEDYRDKMEADSRCEDKVMVEKEVEEEERKKYATLRKRKRQRRRKFEMFKGLCENIVNKMMEHQEELHKKFLEDMVKREEEKIAREEAWRKQEMEQIEKEMEIRAHEQALAFDRQAKIIEFLKKFSSSTTIGPKIATNYDHDRDHNSQTQSQIHLANVEKRIHEDSHDVNHDHIAKVPKPSTPSTPTSCNTLVVQSHQNPNSFPTQNSPNLPTSSNDENQASSSNPNSITSTKDNPFSPCKSPENPKGIDDEIGEQDGMGSRRWPRDEVLALINIRCSFYKAEDHRNDNKLDQGNGPSSSSSGSLWERISRRMMDLGYKRSAKRCKEKWENINKYFRKTKDMNKKRSLDSRTCPYFHQLSNLYNQGTIAATPENRSVWPENQPDEGDDDHAWKSKC